MDEHELQNRKCRPCEGGTAPLSGEEADTLLGRLHDWTREEEAITRTFGFSNYYETMAFVNAVAYISHREDHHPDMSVSYKTCAVTYTTHAIGGLSENDFICAAKLDALVAD